jgi:hypothetical protein
MDTVLNYDDVIKIEEWNTFGMDPPPREDYEYCVRKFLDPSDLGMLPDVLMLIIAEYGSTLICHFTLQYDNECIRIVNFDSIGPPIQLSDRHNSLHHNIKNIRLCASIETKFGILDQLSNPSWVARSPDNNTKQIFEDHRTMIERGFPSDSFVIIDDDPRYPRYAALKQAALNVGGIAILSIHGSIIYSVSLKMSESVF